MNGPMTWLTAVCVVPISPAATSDVNTTGRAHAKGAARLQLAVARKGNETEEFFLSFFISLPLSNFFSWLQIRAGLGFFYENT
jgi:hypothetical protein